MNFEAHIQKQIDEQLAIIDAASISIEDAQKEVARISEALQAGDYDALNDMHEDAAAVDNAAQLIGRLTITLTQRLVKLDDRTTYVITDGELISPAGFHPSQRVFIENDVFVQLNRLPRAVGEELNVFKIAARS